MYTSMNMGLMQSTMSLKRKIQLIWVVNALMILFFTVNSLGTCVIAALMGKNWSLLTRSEQMLIIVVIMVNWSSMMMAFLNRSITHLLGEAATPVVVQTPEPIQHVP
jgi:hypothetical protein